VLNRNARDWPDLRVDGVYGPLTARALTAFLKLRGEEGVAVMLMMIRSQQCIRYIELAERNPAQEQFEYGWQRLRSML
jgi:Predicted Peptidoglycan domain